MDMEQAVRQYIADFYHKFYRQFYLHAYSIAGRKSDAEVAVQQAFLAVCKAPEELMSKGNPIRWMEKTIENTALHIVRERRYTAALFSSLEELAPDQRPSAPTDGSLELIDFCQSVVTRDELEFFLRIAEGHSTFADEANRLGIKLSACYKRFEHTREKLRKALEKYHKNDQ